MAIRPRRARRHLAGCDSQSRGPPVCAARLSNHIVFAHIAELPPCCCVVLQLEPRCRCSTPLFRHLHFVASNNTAQQSSPPPPPHLCSPPPTCAANPLPEYRMSLIVVTYLGLSIQLGFYDNSIIALRREACKVFEKDSCTLTCWFKFTYNTVLLTVFYCFLFFVYFYICLFIVLYCICAVALCIAVCYLTGEIKIFIIKVPNCPGRCLFQSCLEGTRLNFVTFAAEPRFSTVMNKFK